MLSEVGAFTSLQGLEMALQDLVGDFIGENLPSRAEFG
jgi:hypothetical protein